MNIEIQYIKEAKRIIENYNEAVKEVETFEKALTENKNAILQLKSSIDELQDKNETDLLKKQKLFDIMNEYNIKIAKLQDILFPYISKLERLKKDSSVLYGILKEKYPGASDKQLQEQIFKQLNELNEKKDA